jgi:hypothetical protein
MLDDLKVVSRGMIAESELIGAAGKALLMGIKPAEITKLMEIAAATSKMTGQTMTEAFADITMGVARQSRMILDNLGIIVDSEKAYADYAKTLGKSSEALTDIEKRQAFMNAVVKSGDDMIKRLGASSGQLEGVNKLIAAQANLWAEVQKTVASMLDKELTGYAKMINWIDEKLKSMRSSAGESSMKDALKEIEMLRSLESKGMAQPGSTMNKQAEFNRRWGGGASEAELANQAAMQRYKANEANKFQGSARVADNIIPYDVDARWKAYEEGLKRAAEEEKKVADEARKAAEEVKRLNKEAFEQITIIEEAKEEFEKAKAKPSRMEQWDLDQAKPNDWEEEFQKTARAYRDALAEEEKKSMAAMVELTERTASAMQDNFSNLFFDAMTGKLKTLEDYAKAVFDTIARMASDMAAQMATEAIFGNLSKSGGGGGGGGLLGTVLGMFGGGTNSSPQGNPYGAGTGDWGAVAHSGGIIGSTSFPQRMMPAWMIDAAPRLHNGLAADEFPAVLQKGERVIPKGKSAGNTNNITINVAAPGGRMDRESLNSIQTGLYTALQRAGSRNS